MPICSYLPCGRPAVPDQVPHLCPDHADLVICPTCQWWAWDRRSYTPCRTCGGSTYCSEAGADRAIREWVREDRYERPSVPAEVRDARWRVSPLWGVYGSDPDVPDFGQEGPWEASVGEGGYPTLPPAPGTPSTGGRS